VTEPGTPDDAPFPEDPEVRDETHIQRLDRQSQDLLQELRVSQAGVQILFAFLLTLAFSDGFRRVSEFERNVYIVTLLSTAAATTLFIGPVSYHRLVFRLGQRAALVTAANRMAKFGLAFLLIAIGGSVLLVTDVVLGGKWAAALTACIVVFMVAIWYVLPLIRRLSSSRPVGRS
jgi:hypothetical protein